MVIINKKRIQIIMACIFISLFAFSIQMSQTQNNTQRTNSSNNLVENELAVDTPLNNENSSSSIRNSSLLLLMEVHLMITLPIW